MHARHLLFAAATVVAFTGTAVASMAQRVPDMHVVRQPRGDVMVVSQASRADAYVAPYADWTYKPVRAGQRLKPGFYAARYAAAAPRGAPFAGKSGRWVRYGDDLLLVNLRNGRITRVVPGGYRSSPGA